MIDSIVASPEWLDLSQVLLDSFERFLHRPLVNREGTIAEQAQRLFHAPAVVVAHGTQTDPILCFANQAALDLWEADLQEMLKMPSRRTAEPTERSERAEMLQRGLATGFLEDYQGIRITTSGKRFQIDNAIIWNLMDGAGKRKGQAATFTNWRFITN